MSQTLSLPQPPPLLLAARNTPPGELAGAIAGQLRSHGISTVQAIGAGAVNQVVKAIAIARGYAAPGGIEVVCAPSFFNITINGEEKTAIRFKVEAKS